MMEHNNKEDGHAGFFRPLINAYIPLPIHGVTAIPGKIAGALMVADAIEDAIPLIHGPIGCSFQRKINPFRPLFSFYETPCTNMSDLEVVFSGEEKLSRGIKETYEKYHPNLIVVITTCASDLIGDDVESVIEETREDVGCEVVYTTGDFVRKAKPVGAQDALYAITDQMLCHEREEIEKNDCSINIVSLPIHNAALKTAEMASVLSEMGININQICFDHTTVRDLYALSKAELTIIDYPMPWTKLMKERLGVDYYTILDLEKYRESKDPELLSPYGIEGSARVFMEIAKRLDKEGEAEEVIERRKKASKASLNIVLGGDGLESAKSMKEKFDLPYVITPYPFGLNNSIDYMELVTRALNKEINREFISAEKEVIKERIEKVFLLLEGIYDTSVAVVGDGGRAFDLAKFLSNELGFNVKILAITSKNYLTPDRVKEDYFESLLIEPDRLEMNEAIKSGGVEMIFGSSMEKKLAFELGVPQVRIFYPILDEVSISDSPYAGFKGTIQLTENIINTVICNYAQI